ncbi:cleavage and polyadenylation factor CF-IA component RNA15 [Enterocytozoon bieneusi H348]|nr:cleavage and polyadenylation factor CF-IA component RNA15 [Enterocytozoon bieneusi H348]|eukprot:XP_002651274.1 cleavage and polyadenylation factor CF-IA component RNA15 [Enterocytozoon bieneusi H348]
MQLFCSIPNIKNDVIKLLESSFDIQGNKQQIEQRMLMMTQKEMEQYPEDIKQRLQKLKFMIQRNQ